MDNKGFENDGQKTKNGDPHMKAVNSDDGGKAVALSSVLSVDGSTLSFHDVQYTVQVKVGKCKSEEKMILKGLSGVFKPGMNAIMGPTGGGKTSLLDVLAARKDPSGLSGSVLIDGKQQPSNFRLISGYVVQDDIVMGTLTVRENLTFSAALRLPTSVNKKEREQRVEDVLAELGLQDCAETKVGTEFIRGISGGERKRTNVGMELIIKPKFLFLDEPTTGLDASTARSVMSTMAQLSHRGRTVIFSIHQPRYSIYRLFDKLHLLSKGNTVYHGPASEALQYFAANGYECEEHDNPADFFLDSILQNQAAIAGPSENGQDDDIEKGKDQQGTEMTEKQTPLKECFEKSKYYNEMMVELNDMTKNQNEDKEAKVQKISYQTSFFTQFGYVGRRAFQNYARNPKTSIGQTILTCGFSALVGIIFFQLDDSATNAVQDRTGALFFLTMNTLMLNNAAVDAFINERLIFMHESISGYYRTSAFFLAKLIGDLIPQRTIPTILYAAIAYWMIGLRPDGVTFLIFMLNLVLTTYAACGLFFFIGTMVSSFFNAMSLIAIVTIVQLLFGGFLINIESVPVWLSWIEYFSIIRYSLKTSTILEFKGRKFCDGNTTLAAMNACQRCLDGDAFLELQGIDASDWGLWQNEMALGIIAVGFMFFAYLSLRFMNKFK